MGWSVAHPYPLWHEDISVLLVPMLTTRVQIYRASVKLVGDMSKVDGKLKISSESQAVGHYMFKIRKSGVQLLLVFPDGSEFGLLNTHTSQALEDLVEHPSVKFEALTHIVTLRETIGR